MAEGARLEIVYAGNTASRVQIPYSPPGKLLNGPLVKWLRHRPFTAVTRVRIPYGSPLIIFHYIQHGGLAQLGEHLPYKQGVGGSSPSSSTIKNNTVLSRGGAVVARRAHNPKVTGSSPVPATKRSRGVAVNMPACHAGDRRFDPGRDRHF